MTDEIKKEFVCDRKFVSGTFAFTDICTSCGHFCISHDYQDTEFDGVAYDKRLDYLFTKNFGWDMREIKEASKNGTWDNLKQRLLVFIQSYSTSMFMEGKKQTWMNMERFAKETGRCPYCEYEGE